MIADEISCKCLRVDSSAVIAATLGLYSTCACALSCYCKRSYILSIDVRDFGLGDGDGGRNKH